MSKKKNYNQERNPLQMVLYTGIVLTLLVFLFVLVLQNKHRQAVFEEKIKEMTAQETEMVMTERKPREETETETEAITAGSSNVTAQTEQTTDEESESVQGETTDETSDAAMAAANVLILNGSERPGVAGTWKSHLESKGYTGVHTATYSEALEQTLIYTDDAALGEALKTEFANAVVHPGKVESGIEINEGETLPGTIDAYVIIGKNNVAIP